MIMWSNVVYFIFVLVGCYCLKRASDEYERRKRLKREPTVAGGRVIIYRLIGWATLGFVIWVAGSVVSELLF